MFILRLSSSKEVASPTFAVFAMTEWPFVEYFRELVAELPFTLMHPKPLDDDRPSSSSSHKSESSNTKENGESGSKGSDANVVDTLVDTNLIQLDT